MTNLPSARRPTIRFVASISVALLLQACKHPLAIEGEGDIVERLVGHRGCPLEEFQASSPRCTENEVAGEDYIVSYEAIPRPGWKFDGWAGGTACAPESTPPYCDYNVDKEFVELTDQLWPGTVLPPTVAVFSRVSLRSSFTLKMLKNTGENPFAQLAYQCDECSFAQHAAIEPPPGWSKAPTQVVFPIGELRSTPSIDGVPSSVDFVPEIPGNEFKLIARPLNGRILEFGENGPMLVIEVMRDTILRFPAGSRVHELTDPEGNVFVLFGYEVESSDFTSPDFEDADALVDYPRPAGWTYSTRILDQDLMMESNGVVSVLSIRGEAASTWEQR